MITDITSLRYNDGICCTPFLLHFVLQFRVGFNCTSTFGGFRLHKFTSAHLRTDSPRTFAICSPFFRLCLQTQMNKIFPVKLFTLHCFMCFYTFPRCLSNMTSLRRHVGRCLSSAFEKPRGLGNEFKVAVTVAIKFYQFLQ